MADSEATIRVLERENEELRARVQQLEEAFGLAAPLPAVFGLTGKEAGVLGVLLERDVSSKEQIMSALYAFREDGEMPEIKIVDVFVCKLRRKLAGFGVEITTVWGHGYRLTGAMKARMRALIDDARAAA